MRTRSSSSAWGPPASLPSVAPTVVSAKVPSWPPEAEEASGNARREIPSDQANARSYWTPNSHVQQRNPELSTCTESDELIRDVLRLRWLCLVGAVAWSLFVLRDWILLGSVRQSGLAPFLSIRLVGLLLLLAAWFRLGSAKPLTRLSLTGIDLGLTSSLGTIIGVLCLQDKGSLSAYGAAVLVVLVARSSILAAPWRRGLLLLGVAPLFFLATCASGALLEPHYRSAWSTAEAENTLLQGLFGLVAALGVCVWAGHGNWAIRRQLFASRSVGKYTLKHRIGRGGMGEVWVANHPALHRDVALKILQTRANSDPIAVRRFEKEVQAMTRLKHPNTVRVFDYGISDDGLWYYAMELLEGGTLKELVDRVGHLELRRALRIAHHVARALSEAHLQGIIHRDIKPENIFIMRAGNEPDFVKVLDFGIAKIQDDEGDPTLTRAGTIFGTPEYISPEAARGKSVGPASDVYGVGAVLYFMLTGSPPFTGDHPVEILLAHVERSAPEVAATPGVIVDEDVERLVHRCLARVPEQRFSDACALAEALGELRKYR